MIKIVLGTLFVSLSLLTFSQSKQPEVNNTIDSAIFMARRADDEKTFSKYIASRHLEDGGLVEFKKKNAEQYYKELSYYSESFYIKRDHLPDGASLNKSSVCITRFEKFRKESEEAVVVLPGYKDVIILLPTYKLVFKP